MNNQVIDITSELHTVHGGGKAKAIWKGAKAAYKAARPYMKETADFIKDTGIIGGGIYGAKKAWDWATGGGQQAPAQPAK